MVQGHRAPRVSVRAQDSAVHTCHGLAFHFFFFHRLDPAPQRQRGKLNSGRPLSVPCSQRPRGTKLGWLLCGDEEAATRVSMRSPEHLSAGCSRTPPGTRAALRAVRGTSEKAGLCSGFPYTRGSEESNRARAVVGRDSRHPSSLGVGSDRCGVRSGLVLACAQT